MSIDTGKFVAKKQFPSGVRKIITGACKRPTTPKVIAGALSKQRGKRYSEDTVGNALRWLQWQGYVARHGDEMRSRKKIAASKKRSGKNKKRTVH